MSGMPDDPIERVAHLGGRLLSSGHRLWVGVYPGGRAAIRAMTPNGETECTITVNLPDHPLAPGEFHVRNETHVHAGLVVGALVKDGIAKADGRDGQRRPGEGLRAGLAT